jgi:alpha-tubulin suppressor-like RCC1 family protein
MKISRQKRLFIAAGILLVGACAVVGVWLAKSRVVPSKFSVGAALPAGRVSPQLVSAMDDALLLAPDGSLWAWGGNHSLGGWLKKNRTTEVPQQIGADCDWCGISASANKALALKTNGTLWGWGRQCTEELTAKDGLAFIAAPTRIGSDTNWAEISAGIAHCMAVKTDGSLWAWGQDRGQLGDATVTNKCVPTRVGNSSDWHKIAAGALNSYGLKRDGTLWGWGRGLTDAFRTRVSEDSKGGIQPRQIDASTNWITMAAGDFFLLALKSDGTMWITGPNAQSVVREHSGGGKNGMIFQIGDREGWSEIYAGGGSFMARKSNGRWFACGGNASQQLGLGKDGIVTTPERLFIDAEPWAFATGSGNSLLLTRDGKLWSWGKRIGSDAYPATLRIKKSVNRFMQHLPRSPHPFSTEPFEVDITPFKLWNFTEAIGNRS